MATTDRMVGRDEAVVLERWIRERLDAAGYVEPDVSIAIDESLDWRTLVRLRDHGCPTGLALRIVR